MSTGRPIRVLHVDDEEDQLRFTKMFLEELDRGVTVDSASDPEQAMRLQGRNGYDIVVSDYKMPGMTGIEFFHRVRASSDVPFILYTGRGGDEVAESAHAAGVDGYVKKEPEPAHYQALLNHIRHTVERRRSEKLRTTQATPASKRSTINHSEAPGPRDETLTPCRAR